jgi:hypothetical protein
MLMNHISRQRQCSWYANRALLVLGCAVVLIFTDGAKAELTDLRSNPNLQAEVVHQACIGRSSHHLRCFEISRAKKTATETDKGSLKSAASAFSSSSASVNPSSQLNEFTLSVAESGVIEGQVGLEESRYGSIVREFEKFMKTARMIRERELRGVKTSDSAKDQQDPAGKKNRNPVEEAKSNLQLGCDLEVKVSHWEAAKNNQGPVVPGSSSNQNQARSEQGSVSNSESRKSISICRESLKGRNEKDWKTLLRKMEQALEVGPR